MIHLGNVDFMLKNGFMHNDEFGGLSKFDDYRPNYNKAMDTNFVLYLGGDSKQTSHDIHYYRLDQSKPQKCSCLKIQMEQK